MERQRYCPIPETILLGELLTRYEIEIMPSHQSHQVEGYRLKQLNQHFSSLKLNELTVQEVARYRDIRLKTISPASLKRELTILSRVLTVASNDWGISVPDNPVKMITLPNSDKASTRRLEAGEEQRLLIGANDQLQRIITLALETGMRRGEILNIKKSHINFPKSVLFIPSTKTDQPRTIPLSSQAITALRGHLLPPALVEAPASPGNHHPNRPKAGHALTSKLDQSVGTGHDHSATSNKIKALKHRTFRHKSRLRRNSSANFSTVCTSVIDTH
jgi:integrase